jgi:hypothetical protein
MCMQPWFFSMGRLHLGHGFVLAMIQFKFSDSALFFNSQVATVVQSTCNQQGSHDCRALHPSAKYEDG